MDIENANVGIHIRWLLEHLFEYEGRKATARVLLAYRKQNRVYVFEGIVQGTIVKPQGNKGFGFDSVFLPAKSNQTLAQAKPDNLNPRAKAVDALLHQKPIGIFPTIDSWSGSWQ